VLVDLEAAGFATSFICPKVTSIVLVTSTARTSVKSHEIVELSCFRKLDTSSHPRSAGYPYEQEAQLVTKIIPSDIADSQAVMA